MKRFKASIDNLIKISLVLFFLSIPLNIVAENIFGGALLFFWIIKSIFIKKPDFSGLKPIKIFLALYLISAVISTFWGVNPHDSLISAHTYIKFFMFFPIISEINTAKDIKKYLLLIVVALTADGIFAVIQHFQGVSRVGGTYFFYMTFAGMASLLSFIILYFIFESRAYLTKAIFAVAYLIVISAVVFSFTRNAWLGMATGFIVFFVIKLKKYAVIPIALLILLYLVMPMKVHKRLESIYHYKNDGSAEARLEMWATDPAILKDYWYRGIGLNNLHLIFKKYTKYKNLNTFNHMHNNYLQVITEYGIVGFISFIYLLLSSLINSMKFYKRTGNVLYLAIFSAIISFSISGIFEYSFGDSEVAIALIVMISFIYNRASLKKI